METAQQVNHPITATGIVAEYNPFHLGHAHHIAETKRLTNQPVIAVMSGSIMQRGEIAFLDKWTRAKLAIAGGVDLVLELPACFSLRSAQYFASGAIQLLTATGVVSHLCCGVESPKSDFLSSAQAIATPAAQEQIHLLMQDGYSYASACAQLLPSAFSQPNDILALEYTKALLATEIAPIYIARQNSAYNEQNINSALASATAIRKAYYEGNKLWQSAVPDATRTTLLRKQAGVDGTMLWQLLAYRLRMLTPNQIAACTECSEGLENLLKQAQNCTSLEEALALCTKKRYTTSRIRRLFMQLLLDTPRALLQQQTPAYLRVLAFNSTGRELLKVMKKTATLPILTKLGKHPEQGQSQAFAEQLQLDIKATDLQALLSLDMTKKKAGLDYTSSPVME